MFMKLVCEPRKCSRCFNRDSDFRGGCQGGDGAREGEDLDDLPFLSPFVLQRFGSALVSTGNLQLKKKQFQKDFRPIDPECTCATCQK